MAASLYGQETHWIGTWGASASPHLADEAQMKASNLLFADQTIREVVHASAGGKLVRVRFSNAYNKASLTVGSAHIALRDKESSVVAASDHALTFGGQSSITIPPDAVVISDPVKLSVAPLSDVAISIYVPKASAGAGIHYAAEQTAYIGAGDQTAKADFEDSAKIESWVFLSGLDVAAPAAAKTIVTFGDSITDGAKSTPDTNRRWPNILANRLAAAHRGEFGVLDEGIGGNRVLRDAAHEIRFGLNALARFDRDVLAQPGVRYVVVLEGINDIGHAGSSAPPDENPTAEELIGGLKQLIERAHERGLKIYGATLLPFEGTIYTGYYTPEKDVKRKAVNEWIRTSHAFDAVIDFDKAVRDPKHPDAMLPAYDGGDHLHPGDAGYQAMGDAINLSLFQ